MNLFALVQNLVPQQALSEFAGRLAASQQPLIRRALIHGFAKAYHIRLDEYARENFNDYQSFNDFFTRELKDNQRPIDADHNAISCPADGTISQLGCIKDEALLQAKGRHYNVAQLLGSYEDGKKFINGSFATVYLAPSNYHRVHMPFDGRLVATRYIPGTLFSVNNTTAEHIPDLFARNERLVCMFETAFGHASVILVGAMIVAGIECVATGKIARRPDIQYRTHDIPLKKGDELGRFYLGSTAIVLLPQAANFSWQANLAHGTKVNMGERIGLFS